MRSKALHPLHAAFSATAAAILFLVSGALGYTIKKSNWSFITGTWSGGVVWWEIFYGVVALIIAAYFWRKGLKRMATQSHVSSHS